MTIHQGTFRTLGRMPRLAVMATVCAAVVLTGCGGKKDKEAVASQTAAKVNKQELTVHQINFVLQQQRGLRQDQLESASHQVLERLIDQELALQKAEESKIDRDPGVQQQLEAARREIIARAYVDRIGAGAAKPTPEQVKQFYETKPALFKARAIYNLQEILVEATPQQVAELKPKVQAAKNANEIVELLRGAGLKFAANQAVRAAEQLPLQSLDAFAAMKEGEVRVDPAPNGMRIVVLAGLRQAPVSLEQATPAIEQYLLNDHKRELIAAHLKQLRADAKIEYVGKFKEGVPAASASADAGSAPATLADSAPAAAATAAPVPAPAPAPAPAAASAASGLDTSTITKGLGIK
jgi:EpsD family peptidyl-prolyl cis-trans isomerase